MTREMIVALTDAELAQVIDWAAAEQKARAERHKQETIAKIRELARSIEVAVKIEGTRGRPAIRGVNSTILRGRANNRPSGKK